MSTRNAFSSAVFAAALLLGACTSMVDAGTSGEAVQLGGTEWVLTSIGGASPVAGSSITVRFDQGNASGSAGCNQYRGPFTVAGESLTFGMIAATKRACAESERNAQETAYLDALSRVASYRVAAGRLVLQESAGRTLLEYSRN